MSRPKGALAAVALLCALSLMALEVQGHHRRHRHHERRFFDAHGRHAHAHALQGLVSRAHARDNSLYGAEKGRGPEGDSPPQGLNNTVSNVTAQLGGAAFLPCRVGHLGDTQISWIRRRDWHVLTSADVLYTPDRRFSVLHAAGSRDWTLHVRHVAPSDGGTYECQVSTGTGAIARLVHLHVLAPEATLEGRGPYYHVDRGSPITLTCLVTKSPSPPRHVLWYHGDELLNYARGRPEVAIEEEEEGEGEGGRRKEAAMRRSRLRVAHASERHSGNYTCSAPNTRPASTIVFVTEGDKTAAVQRIDSSSSSSSSSSSLRRRPPSRAAFLLLLFLFLPNRVLAVR